MVAVAVLVSTTTVGATWALASMADPDHSFDVAREAYGGGPPCPAGRNLGTSEWEALKESEEGQRTPPDHGPIVVPPVDFILVVPNELTGVLEGTEVPPGMVAMVPCVEIAEGQLVLVGTGVSLLPERILETGLGSAGGSDG
jgi:hypothetical protein